MSQSTGTTSANAEPYPIECPVCHAAPGTRCRGDHANHIGRGIALAVERSPYEPAPITRPIPVIPYTDGPAPITRPITIPREDAS